MSEPLVTLAWFVQCAYGLVVACLTLFSLHRLHLVWLFWKHRRAPTQAMPSSADGPLPRITVQLPVYDEMYVVERVVRAACALDYARDRLEIQVLDDSNDDTVAIAARVVAEMQRAGHRIEHVRRTTRAGFKAGALANGLTRTSGELVAVFDADFVPPRDALHRLRAPFADPKVAMVQARWSHLNRDYSLLTRLQAVLLDGHFVVEHTARHRSGRFFNFNGTAGMWRRAAIEDAGGWQHDTLTEDLDLSYRAQLRGWRFVYLPDYTVPGELPVEISGFRSQQRRWAMGSAQTARKLAVPVWRSQQPFHVKLAATAHLGGNLGYVLTTLLTLLLAPALATRELVHGPAPALLDFPLLLVGSCVMVGFYALSQTAFQEQGWRRWPYVPLAMGLGVALSIHNSVAVLRGLAGISSTFERTPKYGVTSARDTWVGKRYQRAQGGPWIDLALAAAGAIALALAVDRGLWGAFPIASVLAFGYAYSAWRIVHEGRVARDRALLDGPEPAAA